MSALVVDEFKMGNLQKSADFIRTHISCPPKLLIICGSGLGGLADSLENTTSLDYQDIPNFPKSTVEGHAGKLIFGTLSNVSVVCMKGRCHYYEVPYLLSWYSLGQITAPIRILKLLGVQGLIVTNAAGGVNEDFKVGDVMVIKDHVNFLAFGGQHPLRGINDPSFGERFFPIDKAYDRELIRFARVVAKEVGLENNYHEGVYGIYAGPSFETVAEVKILKLLGVDAAGMSTVPEVLVAKHCGLSVFGFSIITNTCIATYDDDQPQQPDHDRTLNIVDSNYEKINQFVTKIVEYSRKRWS